MTRLGLRCYNTWHAELCKVRQIVCYSYGLSSLPPPLLPPSFLEAVICVSVCCQCCSVGGCLFEVVLINFQSALSKFIKHSRLCLKTHTCMHFQFAQGHINKTYKCNSHICYMFILISDRYNLVWYKVQFLLTYVEVKRLPCPFVSSV